jgi:curved DNA-binding protein CbpA
MPPRPAIPSDDLYATLGVPVDASPEAIEIAWRGLLRRHHPDVAGDEGLALAKRINVAHDWLADAELRRRYDEVRGPARPPWADGGWRARPGEGSRGQPARRRPPRPPTMAELVSEVVERVRVLTRDELDRLALAEPAPIAFLATLRRFVPPDLAATLDDAARRALAGLPAATRMRPAIRDAIEGQLASIVLADTLVDLLGDAAAERASERLGDTPWPDAASPEEDEALRVSSELAAMDASATLAGTPIGARRAAARIAHLLALRHAFPTPAFDRLAAPWLGGLIPTESRRSRPVRRPK